MSKSHYRKFYDTLDWKRLRREVLERDDYRCAYCDGPANQGDHILPRSLGGEDTVENLAACCPWCNNVAGGEWFAGIEDKRAWIAERIAERDCPDLFPNLTQAQFDALRRGTPYPLSMERSFERAEATLARTPRKTKVGRPATYTNQHIFPKNGGRAARRRRHQRQLLTEWDG